MVNVILKNIDTSDTLLLMQSSCQYKTPDIILIPEKAKVAPYLSKTKS